MGVGEPRQGLDIHDVAHRVGDGFRIDQPGAVGDGRLQSRQVVGIDEGGFDTQPGQNGAKQAVVW